MTGRSILRGIAEGSFIALILFPISLAILPDRWSPGEIVVGLVFMALSCGLLRGYQR